MYTLKIKVTRAIIDHPHTCQAKTSSCAFAVAVREIFPDAQIYGTMINFDSKKLGVYLQAHGLKRLPGDIAVQEGFAFILPEDMQAYIQVFDSAVSKSSVPEAEFDLEIPDSVIADININEVQKILANTPHLELVEA